MNFFGFKEEMKKLIEEFGAKELTDDLKLEHPMMNFYFAHRDFDRFLKNLKNCKRVAVVSGVNASGDLHLGHVLVFDFVKYLQNLGCEVFIPISDDETYVTKKIDDLKKARENALSLAKQLLALGLNPEKTYFIIDTICTNIYQFAMLLSRGVTLSTIKAVYGYSDEDNPGLIFYPCVQSAHVLLPFLLGYEDVVVPIGIDEDPHLRVARDLAPKFELEKPSVLICTFLEGTDGQKMSKSKGNYIALKEENLKEKVFSVLTGGRKTKEEQLKYGGNPDICVVRKYLAIFSQLVGEKIDPYEDCKCGKILCGECKNKLYEIIKTITDNFKKNLEKDYEIKLLNEDLLKYFN